MSAIELLRQQHEELRILIERCAASTIDARADLFRTLDDLWGRHATLEERIFYPAGRSMRTTGQIDSCYRDHADARMLMDRLREMEVRDPRFLPTFERFRAEVYRHFDVEEESLFPRIQTHLGTRRIDQLGAELREAGEALRSPVGVSGPPPA